MSDYRIKVGLELNDDIKELIHEEIIRQLKEYQNCSVLTSEDNFIWTEVRRDNESSNVIYTPEKLIFYKDDKGKYTFKNEKNEIYELRQEINELKCKLNTLLK